MKTYASEGLTICLCLYVCVYVCVSIQIYVLKNEMHIAIGVYVCVTVYLSVCLSVCLGISVGQFWIWFCTAPQSHLRESGLPGRDDLLRWMWDKPDQCTLDFIVNTRTVHYLNSMTHDIKCRSVTLGSGDLDFDLISVNVNTLD